MGKIYARAIIAGTRTYESVGNMWKAKTKKALHDFVLDGTITAEEYEQYVGEAFTE